ncbi:MAG: class I SAM-dependent methyltransferase [Cyclobacteriaceae bacterium]
MYEKVESCPVCNSRSFQNYIICQDASVSNESFALTKCAECGFIATNPRPNENEISKYYESEDYISHSDKGNNLTNVLYKLVRKFTLRQKLRLLNFFKTEKQLLDYGCGTGDFIAHCANNGWSVTGIEPNPQAREIAEKKVGKSVFNKLKKLDADQTFDIITLWHVLEHVHDINKLLKKLKALLSKKGFLIIALPNCDSWDQKHYKEHWAAYDVPRHLHHFNPLTFKTLAKNHQLKLTRVLPMKFDAFYVSLLSEKYKNGKQNFLQSFINGWKSNNWAKQNNNNYSSVIYILKKK